MLKRRFHINVLGFRPKDQQLTRAIESAYLLWSKRYPELSVAFFDRHFLHTRVMPLFAECPDGASAFDPAILAQRWTDQFPNTEKRHQRLMAQLTPAAADLLHFIEAEQRYFASEAARRQARRRHFWAQLRLRSLSNAASTFLNRLLRRHARPAPDCP